MRLKIKCLIFYSFEGWNISLALPVKLSSRVTMCYRIVRLEITFVVCLRQQGRLYSAFAPLLGIWMGKIIKITKRAIGIMSNSKHNAHMDPLFETLKLLKINDKDVQCMIFWYRFVNNNVPTYLASMCTVNPKTFLPTLRRQPLRLCRQCSRVKVNCSFLLPLRLLGTLSSSDICSYF